MDRYFYSVELDDDGDKIIHMSGNVYLNDVDETETNYRCAEWTWLYIEIDELKEMIEKGWFYEYLCERVAYLGDHTEAEAIEICEHYFGGKPGDYLHIADVNEETPCGHYWYSCGEE